MASSSKQQFLESYDREHATTMRVLRAFPKDKADTKLHPKLKTAKELAWVFVLECGLGVKVWHDEFAKGVPASKDYRELVSSTSDAKLSENVHFFTAPKTMGKISRLNWAWFLLHDQIHHRGQFSIYLRMADAKVPSIYGPTADEPWF